MSTDAAGRNDPDGLTGKTVLVTGGSRGLGAAIARRVAAAGADVVLTYRSRAEEAEEVAEAVRALGRECRVRVLDLERPESIDALFDYVAADVGRLDALVMNAAATSFRPLMETTRTHVERTFAISVTGFLQAVQRAVPLMERSDGGRIVAVSGADVETWIPAHGVLGAAKAAMETFVRYLGAEIAERGITIVGVRPGWMSGESLEQMLGPLYDAAIDYERRTHPMRTEASPDDIAGVVALLCRDEAAWMNGATVAADGAGVFAFCGRYAQAGAEAVMARGGPDAGGAPSVPTA